MVKSSLDLDDERSVQIKPLTNDERFEKMGLQKLVVDDYVKEVTENNSSQKKPSPAPQKKEMTLTLDEAVEVPKSPQEEASAGYAQSLSNQSPSVKVHSDKHPGESATNEVSGLVIK